VGKDVTIIKNSIPSLKNEGEMLLHDNYDSKQEPNVEALLVKFSSIKDACRDV